MQTVIGLWQGLAILTALLLIFLGKPHKKGVGLMLSMLWVLVQSLFFPITWVYYGIKYLQTMKEKDCFEFRDDKVKHFALCLLLSIVSPMLALGAALTKEWCDSRTAGNHWCWADVIADMLGVFVGGAIHYLFFGSFGIF